MAVVAAVVAVDGVAVVVGAAAWDNVAGWLRDPDRDNCSYRTMVDLKDVVHEGDLVEGSSCAWGFDYSRQAVFAHCWLGNLEARSAIARPLDMAAVIPASLDPEILSLFEIAASCYSELVPLASFDYCGILLAGDICLWHIE